MNEQTDPNAAVPKREFLLTWYGITDLRTALGLETGGGPILAALKTGKFTTVLILAYTNPTKKGKEVAENQAKWNQWLGRSPQEREVLARSAEMELVDAFSNTAEAHQLFKTWVRSKMQELGLTVSVHLCTKELTSLNDSKGIYDAVIQAVDIALSEVGEKQISFYLSPGTPVMAFTWAFVALTNPELDIQILSSSDPRQPPTLIGLPYDLIAPSSRRLKHVPEGDSKEFDAVFHLFGEQRMAPLLGVLQFTAKRHIFVTSEQFSSVIMKQFVPDGTWSQLAVNPFDPMSAKVQILREVASLPQGSRVGFNLTGGTKLMFAGAIAACRKVSGVPFYFETREHSLIFLHDFSSMPMRGVDNVDLFFQVNGFTVAAKGGWDDNSCRRQRKLLTHKLWKDRRLIAQLYRRIAEYADYAGDDFVPFNIRENVYKKGKAVPVDIDLHPTARAYLNLDGAEFTFDHCPDFAKYLAGKWLEEYTYLLLETLFLEGKIRDLRIGLEVTLDSLGDEHDFPIQEFDVAFTDGKRLFIVECKAGAVFSDDVYKLQHCVRNYGGIDARGIMACAFPPRHPQTRRRLESAANLSGLYDWNMPKDLVDLVLRDLS